MNPNHDGKTGEFSSGGDGGSPSAQRPLNMLGERQRLSFNASKTNHEIERLKATNPDAKPVMVSLTDKQVSDLKDTHDFYVKQGSTDHERMKSIMAAGSVPPLIVGGTKDDFWILDGTHRAALAAHQGVTKIPVYFR